MLVMAALCRCVYAQPFQKTNSGIEAVVNGNKIELQFYTPSIIRVIKVPAAKGFNKKSLSVILKPLVVKFSVIGEDDIVNVKTSEINIKLNLNTGAVSFFSLTGQPLLMEKPNGSKFSPFIDAGEKSYHVDQTFILEADEPIYGLGQHQKGNLNQRNHSYRLEPGNVEDGINFFQSIKGYGLFWDNYSPTDFSDNADGTRFKSDVGDGIDYYFMYGGNADKVIAGMRQLTGQAPLFPLWTYGYWQSKERYKSQAEIVGVVKKYRELGVPLDGIVQDWQYWGNNYLWNAMDFLNSEFQNPQKMIQDIHEQNAHLIISIWSSFGPNTKPYAELNNNGMLFNFVTWPESGVDKWPPDLDYPSGVRVYDAYNPKARDIYWKYASSGLFGLGVDGWWMDSTEPDHLRIKDADFDTKTYLGSFRKVRSAYPLMSVGGVYEHQRKETSAKRVFILTRSAFAGQQRYGANTWSGDVASSWNSLRNQISAGLNFSLTGIPHWNADIGGFFANAYNKTANDGSGAQNPLFQELYVRWLQFGTFTPMMRSHGTEVPREIYNFGKKGEPIYDAINKFIDLRYALLPYIYSTSWDVSDKQSTFMRALFMDFPSDKNVWDINNQYMFGKSILVAPIVNAQYTPEKILKINEETGWERKEKGAESTAGSNIDFTAQKSSSLYLPSGSAWYDFWTNEKLAGGQRLRVKTRIDMIPLYVKAGSILPVGPKVQYATEKKWDNLEIKIYPGANGAFILYEDEFDNYNYEKGAFTEIKFLWHDVSRTLSIEDRKGAYNDMLIKRNFTLVLPTGEKKVVAYSGKKIDIAL